MIPKVIHYCWFGRGEMPKLMKKCIKSWKKYCPDYQITEWNEDNFDICSTEWTKEAYEAKKYAFVADYVRLKVLFEHGGIYLDTDQELIKPLDPFLNHKAFLGFMQKSSVSMGVVGAIPKHGLIEKLFSHYENRRFLTNGKEDKNPNTEWVSEILLKEGFVQNNQYQVINYDTHIYPQTYFCPTSCVSIEDVSGPDTVSIHHWAMTWRKKSEIKTFARVRRHQTKWYRALENARYLPNKVARKILGDSRYEKVKKRIKND